MLIVGSRFIHTPVMSLQTGSELARTSREVIDPSTLEIIAYELEGPLLTERPSLLRIADVREFSDIGIIVDSSDEFVSPNDIIKLGDVYKLHFTLLGKHVIDQKRRKLGKVNGYTIDTTGFLVQQLSVKRPLLKSLNDTELLVHRSQIVEVNDAQIIVRSMTEEIKDSDVQPIRSYHNPFRSSPQANSADAAHKL
jgi:uncharacterized protein YrrD